MTMSRERPSTRFKRALKALIVEDDPPDAELMVAMLKRVGFEVTHKLVDSLAGFRQEIEQGEYDLVLADYNLRTWTALEALEALKQGGKDVPFVIVTGALGDEAAVDCIKQGATDYVLKHRLHRLPVVVERALRDKAQHEEALRLEELIRHGKQEWELTFDTVPDPILVLGPDFRIQRANRATAELLGVECSQLPGQVCYELMHCQDRPIELCPHRRMMRTGQQESEDVEIPRLGKIFHVTASPLRNDGVTVQGCVHVMRDITLRKRAEEALRRSEASYRSLILGASYGIFRCDVAGKFLAVNPALTAMLGYGSEEELRSANLLHDIAGDAEEGARLLQQYRQKGRVDGIESAWKRKDGTTLFVRLSGRTVLDGQGSLEGFEVIAEDVRERRRLEEQLRQAQKMEAVGRLAGGIAHDFNNLLTVLTGYSDLLLSKFSFEDSARGYLQEVKKAAERATDLTRQLLAFSRKQVLAPQVLDLNTVVSGMDKMLRHVIGEDIEFVNVLDPALARVKADPGQIEQVILNLAVNARDAMPQGGKLTVTTANVDLDRAYARRHILTAPGPHVMLAVSDTGCGMDAETLNHVFEPFFTSKEPGKGTGLGLAMVYGIVQQSGGNIWVYSEPGKGSTFKIYLPLVTEPVARDEPREKPEGAARGSEVILVVEDDAAVRPLVQGVLGSHGYTVLTASEPEEAVRACQNHPGVIDLLLTDVVMPTMSGRKLAEHLAFLRPKMKVLYMSGYTDDAIVRHGVLEKGMAFLQKPFTPVALMRRVRQVLDAAG